jgi:hypothetical protein
MLPIFSKREWRSLPARDRCSVMKTYDAPHLRSPNPTLERNATSVAPRAGARIFSVSRGAAGAVRSTLR